MTDRELMKLKMDFILNRITLKVFLGLVKLSQDRFTGFMQDDNYIPDKVYRRVNKLFDRLAIEVVTEALKDPEKVHLFFPTTGPIH
jgi:hypothetical protein